MPLAPGLFSTTTDWPIDSESFDAIILAVTSEAPPGGYTTIILMDCFEGQDCALAVSGRTAAIQDNTTKRIIM
jgi:hypothetical protein